MFLRLDGRILTRSCLPHVRGGVSRGTRPMSTGLSSSPRAWGCFSLLSYLCALQRVFPTCVGVFLKKKNSIIALFSLPHVRGGVSSLSHTFLFQKWSSPRAWGCFSTSSSPMKRWTVFPTCVGVFLSCLGQARPLKRLPHVRGGVSTGQVEDTAVDESSPRAWGCFWCIQYCP